MGINRVPNLLHPHTNLLLQLHGLDIILFAFTVEPWYNEFLYNKVLRRTNNTLCSSDSKINYMKKNLDITKPHYSKYYLASPLFGPSLYRGITVHYYSEHLKSIVLIKHDFGFSLLYSTNFKITDTNSDTRKNSNHKKEHFV